MSTTTSHYERLLSDWMKSTGASTPPRVLTTDQISRIAGVSVRTAMRWIAVDGLPSERDRTRKGRPLLVRTETFIEWASKNKPARIVQPRHGPVRPAGWGQETTTTWREPTVKHTHTMSLFDPPPADEQPAVAPAPAPALTPAPAPLPVDEPRATLPHNGTATSKRAAELAEPAADTDCGRILTFLRKRGAKGATREEIAVGLGMLIQTVTPRVHTLINAQRWGLAYETGETREGGTGRASKIVYAKPMPTPTE